MSTLEFEVLDIAPDPYAAAPTLTARIRITETSGAVVHAMALRCQVRIEPQRRQYEGDVEGLSDLFGPRHRWGATLKSLLWMHTSAMVKGFTDQIEIEMSLPCTYDFEVAATKYLHAVRTGDIPLALLFNGTVFTRGDSGFQVEQIPWHADIEYRMPARVWHDTMDAFFPNSGWIRVSRQTIDALDRYRTDRGLTGWEEAFRQLLGSAGAHDRSSRTTASRQVHTVNGVAR
jgi:Family of unknown function (DUF6084)